MWTDGNELHSGWKLLASRTLHSWSGRRVDGDLPNRDREFSECGLLHSWSEKYAGKDRCHRDRKSTRCRTLHSWSGRCFENHRLHASQTWRGCPGRAV
jgi:hypothetical protein